MVQLIGHLKLEIASSWPDGRCCTVSDSLVWESAIPSLSLSIFTFFYSSFSNLQFFFFTCFPTPFLFLPLSLHLLLCSPSADSLSLSCSCVPPSAVSLCYILPPNLFFSVWLRLSVRGQIQQSVSMLWASLQIFNIPSYKCLYPGV